MDVDDDTEAPLFAAIRGGDLDTLGSLLRRHARLASTRLSIAGGRTPLLVATDWPGYFPQGPAVARLLLDAGADPNVRSEGRTPETPLHWTASSDDVDVAEVLIDRGADIEAAAGSIGTPLDNAIGYGCWHVARCLHRRGARVNGLWQAAALGLLDDLERLLAADPAPSAEDLGEAFWQACSGGQLRAAALLLSRGADMAAKPGYAGDGSVLDAAAGPDTRRSQLVEWLRDKGAATANVGP